MNFNKSNQLMGDERISIESFQNHCESLLTIWSSPSF